MMDEMDGTESPSGEHKPISLGNRKVTFGDAPDLEAERTAAIVGLKFTARFEGHRKFTVDLTAYPLPGVAKEAISIIWEESQGDGKYRSPGGLTDLVSALRAFGSFAAPTQSIAKIGDITADHIDGFERSLQEKHGQDHPLPYKRMVSLVGFLNLAQARGLTSGAVSDRVKYISLHKKGTGYDGNRDAYSLFVTQQVRTACEKEIEETIQRITVEGPRVLAGGADPAVHGWTSPANVMWAMVNQGLSSTRRCAPALKNILQGLKTKSGSPYSFGELIGFVHMQSEDVLPFWILLSLDTGLPIECVRELKSDCLRNEARGYADLHYTKRRDGGAVDEDHMRIRVDGRLAPGALIKIVLNFTKATRRLAPADEADWLFIGYGRRPRGDGTSLRRLVLESDLVYSRRLCAKYGIVDDDKQPLDGLTLARLRKTHKAEKYIKTDGHLADVADDHSRSIAAKNYANIPSLRPLHEATIADGLTQALEAAMAPIVLNAAAERRLEENTAGAAEAAGLETEQIAAVASGEGDVWFASCLGFHASPYAEAGTACPRPVWGCLACKNAVITSSKLPAILAFLNHTLERRQQLNLAAWQDRYGEAHFRITQQILPRFPASEVAMAKAIAAAEDDLLWLPAELTMSM